MTKFDPRRFNCESATLQRLRQLKHELNQLIPDEADKTIEGFNLALHHWTCYPQEMHDLWREFSNPPSTSESVLAAVNAVQLTLLELHFKATSLLMRRAEEFGIDSGPIWSEAMLCVDMMRSAPERYYPTSLAELWPYALGKRHNELTPDQRGIIVSGEEAIARLRAKVAMKSASVLKPRRSKNEPLVQFALEKHEIGWTLKEISATWNRLNPGADSTEGSVKKALSRAIKKNGTKGDLSH